MAYRDERTGARHLLESRLHNYARTRRIAPASIRSWCDLLIRETEEQIRQLDMPETRPAEEPPPVAIARLRSTYPFSESADLQRPC
jgi:hypothetical protein